ncbi:hypothetical protein WR25_13135 [Diploscapter pachys]|uniref:Purple acid phosphatase n=1 Tax=Diploscapter pachys TaxID=2018661 RepID=A0A2A2LQ63_9BILA|nr:hypothetical protein WR25_13135 [Diploscapter pachys]
MLTLVISLFIFSEILGLPISNDASNAPEQVHLSLTNDPTEMAVTWITQKSLDKASPYIYYGPSSDALNSKVPAEVTKWTDGGSKSTTRFTYRGIIPFLTPGQKYYYSVGSDEGKSEVFFFTQINPNKEIRAAVFGDFSVKNGYSFDPLIEMTKLGELDLVFHIGDISYDLDDKNGDKGDEFMNAIQPIAAYVPYMVVAGNHEQNQDFLHYKNRFTMPQNGVLNDNQFWSVTLGNYHFVGISSEYYAFNMSTEAQLQFNWLYRDLRAPRSGAPGYPALEPLFNTYGVDSVYWAHKHTYERNWPLINGTPILDNQELNHFHNSPTPVYTLTGTAGCHDHTFPNETIAQPFSALRLGNYGFTYLTLHNSTHLSTVFVDALEPSSRLDPFLFTKDLGYKPSGLKI